jgi:putative membrane protein
MILHWLVSAISLMVTAYLVPGFDVSSFGSALIASLVIGFANIVIRPLLLFITLPLNILTLGLFTFVVNGIVLKLTARFLTGFKIKNWPAAIFGAMVLSLVTYFMNFILHF